MNDDAVTFCDVDYILDGMSAVVEENVVKERSRRSRAELDATTRIRRQARRPRAAAEHAPGVRLPLELLERQAAACRRDHEHVERLAREDAAGRLRHGKADRPVQLARRAVPTHLAGAPDRGPETAVRVDAHPVDEADLGRELELDDATTVRQSSRSRGRTRTRRCLPSASRRSRTSRRRDSSPFRSRARRRRGRGAPDRPSRGSRERRRPRPPARRSFDPDRAGPEPSERVALRRRS